MFMFGSGDEFAKRYFLKMLEDLYSNAYRYFEESLDTQGVWPDSAGAEVVIHDTLLESWENLQSDIPVSTNYRHKNN